MSYTSYAFLIFAMQGLSAQDMEQALNRSNRIYDIAGESFSEVMGSAKGQVVILQSVTQWCEYPTITSRLSEVEKHIWFEALLSKEIGGQDEFAHVLNYIRAFSNGFKMGQSNGLKLVEAAGLEKDDLCQSIIKMAEKAIKEFAHEAKDP